MAIENTIAGSLLKNHDLLKNHSLQIAGEHKLRITHSLAALPGQSLSDIREVMSHPMALMQCEDYLDSLSGIRVLEHDDTALAARDIQEKGLVGTAAICSSLAAEIYGLEILAAGVETNKRNSPAFLFSHVKRCCVRFRKTTTSTNHRWYLYYPMLRVACRRCFRFCLFMVSTLPVFSRSPSLVGSGNTSSISTLLSAITTVTGNQ